MRWLTFHRKSLNVQDQGADRKAQIKAATSQLIENPLSFAWLHEILARQGLATGDGILVSLNCIPEQGGTFFQGIWLTDECHFWAFEALVSRESEQLQSIDLFQDITSSMPMTEHLPGSGASFGFMAVEVLNEIRRR